MRKIKGVKGVKGIKGNKGGKGEKGIKSLEGQLVSRQREDAMRTRGIQKAASIDVKKPRKLGFYLNPQGYYFPA